MMRYHLSNGMEVLLCPHPVANIVAVQCWVHAGSLQESPEQRGLAHLLEHMLFKGTKRRKVGEIARTVEECGGDMNAYTTFDRTVYYLTVASQHVNLGLDILADAIFNSTLDREELVKEIEVVREEIKRSLDNPGVLVGREIFSEMMRGTEAERPIIGFDEQVAKYTHEDAMAFYKSWYQPQNMDLVVVGNFDPEAVKAKINQFFGQAKPSLVPLKMLASPKEYEGQKFKLIKGDYKQPKLEICFKGPKEDDIDAIPLDLAAFALGSGDASRLNRRLRDEEQVVSAISASLYAPKMGGFFEVSVQTNEEQMLEATKQVACEINAFVNNEPIRNSELERARVTMRTDRLLQAETVTGMARSVGYGLTTPHKQFYDDIIETLVNKTQVTDVVKACHEWLTKDNLFVVALVPESSTLTEKDFEKAFITGWEQAVSPTEAAVKEPRDSGKVDMPIVTEEVLPGLTLVYRQNPHAGLFTLTAAAQGGLRGEAEGQEGSFYVVSECLGKATESIGYATYVEEVENAGANLYGFSGKDSFGLKLQCLKDKLPHLWPLWVETFQSPVFPQEVFEASMRDIEDTIRAETDSPAQIAVKAFQKKVFGSHPYANPIYGTKASLERMSPEGLLAFYKGFRDQSKWVFSAIGHLPYDDFKKMVLHAFSGKSFAPKAPKLVGASVPMPAMTGDREDISKAREQVHIVLGGRGLTWDDPDRPALDVLTNILGGSGGRLFLNLRDRQSLAYTVSPFLSYGCQPSLFALYIACAPEKAVQAEEALRLELREIMAAEPTQDELQRSIQYIVGGHEADMQRSDAQAMTMALMEIYGIGYDDFKTYSQRVMRVTAQDVQKVAKKVINLETLVTVRVGNISN